MKENHKRHTKRIRNLVITLVLTALILSVSTYAWFIGMRTVSVSEFSVNIAVAKDLELSLNGQTWGEEVTINAENFNDPEVVYEGNTNWWTGEDENGEQIGLIPVSTIGDINSTTSRLVIYEKLSLTASGGGYRIMTSKVENEEVDGTEAPGYVAFDLFIKNHSGADYIPALNVANEEAIYLSTESAVTVTDGDGKPGTGIENSVRVAFAQIGRVQANDESVTPSIITGIDCDTEGKVTGICTRTAQIWEPNDTLHVEGAINWYNTACRARGIDGAFTADACGEVKNDTAYPTYAIGSEIDSDAAVDVYDGAEYNGYEVTISDKEDETKTLYPYPYFTDTMKVKTAMDRPQFMSLAPNSVTKVRIYIFIEGQDVDNYDFAAIGKSISVKFGFTKQRFTADDIPGIVTEGTTTEQP